MIAAEMLRPPVESWNEVRARYANTWVGLVDLDYAADGGLRAARVVAHDASFAGVLDQLGTANPDATIMHTSGCPLWMPRSERVDESADVVPAAR